MSEIEIPEQPVQQEELALSASRMKRPEAYYDVGRQCYWIRDIGDNWITVNEASLGRQLRACGFSRKLNDGEQISSLDQCMNNIQLKCNVAYAGPLAGHRKGLIENMCGQRILVTNSPNLITPVEGDWPTLRKLQENLFGKVQLPYLWGW